MAYSRLRKISKGFDFVIKQSFEWIRAINESINQDKSILQPGHIYFAYEIAFIKIFTAWERFLEESFVSYLTGCGIKGYRPRCHVKKVNRDHALKMLSGTEDYPDWSKIDEVYTLASLYFVNGAPFTLPLQQIELHFNEMKKIRNVIVHISAKAKEKYEGLIKSKLPYYTVDMTPGEFLGLQSRQDRTKTYFEYYVSYLEAAAGKIIPS